MRPLSRSNKVTVSLAEALRTAIELHRQGRRGEAEILYLAVLENEPENVDALHFLGILRHQQGRRELAVELVSRAVEVKPDYVDAQNNLGNIHQEVGNLEAASACYEKALNLRPHDLNALKNQGTVLRKLGRLTASVAVLQQAQARAPQDVDLLHSLASSYRKLARHDEAAACLQTALAQRPNPQGFLLLGATYYVAGRIAEAAATYAAWLGAEPDNPIARHMVVACQSQGGTAAGDLPARADDAFIGQLFDGFASRFEEVLERLEYRGPALLAAALARSLGPPRADQIVLDAGCGTGLVAPVVRPYAHRLVGVDLSAKMLEKAARRSLYDETVQAELTAFLRSHPAGFDIVASADTLIYFGDLTHVLAAAAAALRPGGTLFFTLERAFDESRTRDGVRLNPHGRYSHTPAHVRDKLAAAGLAALEISDAIIRRENVDEVAGLVVAARRATAAS